MSTIESSDFRCGPKMLHGQHEVKSCVLILMAVFNGERWLSEQLHSIFSQKDVFVHVLACDDGSSDGSIEVIEQFADSGFSIALLSSSMLGGSAGKNFFRLILEAKIVDIDFVAFCDQDDVWRPDHLVRSIKMLEKASADGYSAAVEAFWPDGRKTLFNQSSVVRRADYLFEGGGQGCTFVIRRKTFEEIKQVLLEHSSKLGVIHYHDWTVYAIARRLGCRWVFDPEAAVNYRQHAENDTGARWSVAGVRKRFGLIWSGWYGNQIALISALTAKINIPANHRGQPLESLDPAYYLTLKNSAKSSYSARVVLASWLFRYGRRKWFDRTVLSIAAFLGKL